MNHKSIKRFLISHPRANSVRVTTEEGQQQLLDTQNTPANPVSWVQVAKTIEALTPQLIELLDTKGQIIRARRAEAFDDEEAEADGEGEGATPRAPQNSFIAGPPQPGESETVTIARLIHGAYQHANDTSFNALLGLFEMSLRRNESLERSLETMRRLLQREVDARIEAAGEAAARGEDPLATLAGAFMGGFNGGAQEREASNGASNGRSNGHHKPEPDHGETQ